MNSEYSISAMPESSRARDSVTKSRLDSNVDLASSARQKSSRTRDSGTNSRLDSNDHLQSSALPKSSRARDSGTNSHLDPYHDLQSSILLKSSRARDSVIQSRLDSHDDLSSLALSKSSRARESGTTSRLDSNDNLPSSALPKSSRARYSVSNSRLDLNGDLQCINHSCSVSTASPNSSRIELRLRLLKEERAIRRREIEAEMRALEEEKRVMHEKYRLLEEQLNQRRKRIKRSQAATNVKLVGQHHSEPDSVSSSVVQHFTNTDERTTQPSKQVSLPKQSTHLYSSLDVQVHETQQGTIIAFSGPSPNTRPIIEDDNMTAIKTERNHLLSNPERRTGHSITVNDIRAEDLSPDVDTIIPGDDTQMAHIIFKVDRSRIDGTQQPIIRAILFVSSPCKTTSRTSIPGECLSGTLSPTSGFPNRESPVLLSAITDATSAEVRDGCVDNLQLCVPPTFVAPNVPDPAPPPSVLDSSQQVTSGDLFTEIFRVRSTPVDVFGNTAAAYRCFQICWRTIGDFVSDMMLLLTNNMWYSNKILPIPLPMVSYLVNAPASESLMHEKGWSNHARYCSALEVVPVTNYWMVGIKSRLYPSELRSNSSSCCSTADHSRNIIRVPNEYHSSSFLRRRHWLFRVCLCCVQGRKHCSYDLPKGITLILIRSRTMFVIEHVWINKMNQAVCGCILFVIVDLDANWRYVSWRQMHSSISDKEWTEDENETIGEDVSQWLRKSTPAVSSRKMGFEDRIDDLPHSIDVLHVTNESSMEPGVIRVTKFGSNFSIRYLCEIWTCGEDQGNVEEQHLMRYGNAHYVG